MIEEWDVARRREDEDEDEDESEGERETTNLGRHCAVMMC